MDIRRYLDLFLEESRDHLAEAFVLQSRIETEAADATTYRELMRHAHSLKGMAATMRYRSMVSLTHALEDELQRLQDARQLGPGTHAPLLAECLTCLGRIIERIARGEDDACPQAEALALRLREVASVDPAEPSLATADVPVPRVEPPREASVSAPHTTRWQVELQLDRDSACSAEATVGVMRRVSAFARVVEAHPPLLAPDTRRFEGRLRMTLAHPGPEAALAGLLARLEGVRHVVIREDVISRAAGPSEAPAGRWVRVRSEQLDALLQGLLDLRLEHGRLTSSASSASPELRRQLDRTGLRLKEIHDVLTEIRLVPFDSVAQRFDQAVRELALELDKEAQLVIEGADVRLDRTALESLVDPLLHAVRNAVDHGIESPDERTRLGKTRRGTVTLRLDRRGDRVRVTIADDGRGMAPSAIRARAVSLSLIGEEEAASLGDNESLLLAALPRFSTAAHVSSVSGRGVGLDVVRSQVERLGGAMAMRSEPGVGTSLRLSVPMSVALLRSLLVRCDGEIFALPAEAVDSAARVPRPTADGPAASGGSMRLIRLDRYLGLARATPAEHAEAWAVMLGREGQCVGVVVDEVLRHEAVVVRPLHPPLRALAAYSGAALLEDGAIALVLDPAELTAAAADASPA